MNLRTLPRRILEAATNKMNSWSDRLEQNSARIRQGTEARRRLRALQNQQLANEDINWTATRRMMVRQASRKGEFIYEVIGNVIWKLLKLAIIGWFVLSMVNLVLTTLTGKFYHDGTDRVSHDRVLERSGVTVRTDWTTGCQYIESWTGSLVPRMIAQDTDGKRVQVCIDTGTVEGLIQLNAQSGHWHKKGQPEPGEVKEKDPLFLSTEGTNRGAHVL